MATTETPRTQDAALERVRAAAEAQRDARAALEEAIIVARRDVKCSLRAVAEAAGTTHETIRKIAGEVSS